MPVVYQQYNLCICIEPQVSCPGFHLKYTFNGMLMFCKKLAAVLSVLDSLETLVTGGRHFHNTGQ